MDIPWINPMRKHPIPSEINEIQWFFPAEIQNSPMFSNGLRGAMNAAFSIWMDGLN
jgi:hypothetical protein